MNFLNRIKVKKSKNSLIIKDEKSTKVISLKDDEEPIEEPTEEQVEQTEQVNPENTFETVENGYIKDFKDDIYKYADIIEEVSKTKIYPEGLPGFENGFFTIEFKEPINRCLHYFGTFASEEIAEGILQSFANAFVENRYDEKNKNLSINVIVSMTKDEIMNSGAYKETQTYFRNAKRNDPRSDYLNYEREKHEEKVKEEEFKNNAQKREEETAREVRYNELMFAFANLGKFHNASSEGIDLSYHIENIDFGFDDVEEDNASGTVLLYYPEFNDISMQLIGITFEPYYLSEEEANKAMEIYMKYVNLTEKTDPTISFEMKLQKALDLFKKDTFYKESKKNYKNAIKDYLVITADYITDKHIPLYEFKDRAKSYGVRLNAYMIDSMEKDMGNGKVVKYEHVTITVAGTEDKIYKFLYDLGIQDLQITGEVSAKLNKENYIRARNEYTYFTADEGVELNEEEQNYIDVIDKLEGDEDGDYILFAGKEDKYNKINRGKNSLRNAFMFLLTYYAAKRTKNINVNDAMVTKYYLSFAATVKKDNDYFYKPQFIYTPLKQLVNFEGIYLTELDGWNALVIYMNIFNKFYANKFGEDKFVIDNLLEEDINESDLSDIYEEFTSGRFYKDRMKKYQEAKKNLQPSNTPTTSGKSNGELNHGISFLKVWQKNHRVMGQIKFNTPNEKSIQFFIPDTHNVDYFNNHWEEIKNEFISFLDNAGDKYKVDNGNGDMIYSKETAKQAVQDFKKTEYYKNFFNEIKNAQEEYDLKELTNNELKNFNASFDTVKQIIEDNKSKIESIPGRWRFVGIDFGEDYKYPMTGEKYYKELARQFNLLYKYKETPKTFDKEYYESEEKENEDEEIVGIYTVTGTFKDIYNFLEKMEYLNTDYKNVIQNVKSLMETNQLGKE